MNYHIVPTNDIKEHEPTTTCSCNPKIETYHDGEMLVRHNAYDGREHLVADHYQENPLNASKGEGVNESYAEAGKRGILTECIDSIRTEQNKQSAYVIEIDRMLYSIYAFPDEVGSILPNVIDLEEGASAVTVLTKLLEDAKDLNKMLDKLLNNVICLI